MLLYDLTSTYFEGLAEDNDLAKRGYSRDHRSDCKQVVLALVVTREGFPLAHHTLAGNTQDLQTVRHIVSDIEARFGKANRVWVMDRGMISEDTLTFPQRTGPPLSAGHTPPRSGRVPDRVAEPGIGSSLPDNPQVEVKLLERDGVALSAGPQPTTPQKGTGHPSPPTSRPGQGPEKAARARRPGPPEKARQDPGSGRPAQRPLSQSLSLREDHT